MSRANQQSLCLLAAMRSGLITVNNEIESLNPCFQADLIECDRLLFEAVRQWDGTDKDNAKALNMLGMWVDELKESGLHDECNMVVMVSMSQQSCQALTEKVKNKEKLALLMPIQGILDKMAAYLHEGIKDQFLIPKFELADLILEKLFKVTGFENY